MLAACSGGNGGNNTASDLTALLAAESHDGQIWIIPGKTYAGNRATGLDEITPANVSQLKRPG